jgi:hypothetical protein
MHDSKRQEPEKEAITVLDTTDDDDDDEDGDWNLAHIYSIDEIQSSSLAFASLPIARMSLAVNGNRTKIILRRRAILVRKKSLVAGLKVWSLRTPSTQNMYYPILLSASYVRFDVHPNRRFKSRCHQHCGRDGGRHCRRGELCYKYCHRMDLHKLHLHQQGQGQKVRNVCE